eukprot:CAMPEP_0194271982 /NCGR_PEP_ID=MMETSP0169-20130528/5658_1 /TAXON_ID=218684 /ORGANISM="Corethron pennatum, Strain L29A3" /LENGTH=377 /DNA_ID=CAMNT_0039014511 /DNA_START=45 /DNA_END=1177 /DNA_ORIENTATION=-
MAPTEHQRSARLGDPKLQPKKARVARYLAETGPQIVERSAKGLLLMKGTSCSQHMSDVLRDLRTMKTPHAKLLQKNNAVYPFEDAAPVEFLTTKNDASTFAIASSNKKRPNNLLVGRTFDRQVLDMVELGVARYVGLKDEKYRGAPKKRIGSKPMMVFAGDYFHNSGADGRRVQSLLLDFFGGFERSLESISLAGLDHVLSVTAGTASAPGVNGTTATSVIFHVRTYHVKLKKNPEGGGGAAALPDAVRARHGPHAAAHVLRAPGPVAGGDEGILLEQPDVEKGKKDGGEEQIEKRDGGGRRAAARGETGHVPDTGKEGEGAPHRGGDGEKRGEGSAGGGSAEGRGDGGRRGGVVVFLSWERNGILAGALLLLSGAC